MVDPRGGTPASLAQRTSSASVWSLGGRVVAFSIRFGSSIVLARLLLPEDFAVASIVGVIMATFGQMHNLGFTETVIREPTVDAEFLSTIFWAAAALGTVVFAVIVALAGPMSILYHDDRLVLVFRLMALSFWVGALGVVPRAILQRDLRFREVNLLEIVVNATVAIGTVALALGGGGYWALLAGSLVTPVCTVPALYLLTRFRPCIRFSRSVCSRMLDFGSGVFLARCLGFLIVDLDYFVFGRYLSKEQFGFYYFAFTKSRMPLHIIEPGLHGPLMAAFVHVGDDDLRLRRAIARVGRMYFSLLAPVGLLLAFVADPVIPAIFGRTWTPAVPIIRLFCLQFAISSAGGFAGVVLTALGSSWTLVKIRAARLLATIVGLSIAVLTKQDLFGCAVVVVTLQAPTSLIALLHLCRRAGFSWLETARIFTPTVLCLAGCTVAAGMVLRLFTAGGAWGPILSVAAVVATFGASYVLLTWWFNEPVIDEMRALVAERSR